VGRRTATARLERATLARPQWQGLLGRDVILCLAHLPLENLHEPTKKRCRGSAPARQLHQDHSGDTTGPGLESSHAALGVVPASESPPGRAWARPCWALARANMQAAAFDETRKVLVMFGGLGDAGELQDLWEWNPASGTWTQRSPIGLPPKPRGGASMVF